MNSVLLPPHCHPLPDAEGRKQGINDKRSIAKMIDSTELKNQINDNS